MRRRQGLRRQAPAAVLEAFKGRNGVARWWRQVLYTHSGGIWRAPKGQGKYYASDYASGETTAESASKGLLAAIKAPSSAWGKQCGGRGG
jgi:hypothetical protein